MKLPALQPLLDLRGISDADVQTLRATIGHFEDMRGNAVAQLVEMRTAFAKIVLSPKTNRAVEAWVERGAELLNAVGRELVDRANAAAARQRNRGGGR